MGYSLAILKQDTRSEILKLNWHEKNVLDFKYTLNFWGSSCFLKAPIIFFLF